MSLIFVYDSKLIFKGVLYISAYHKIVEDSDIIHWFAMSAPYRNEEKAKEKLTDKGFQCFVPMRYELVEKKGKKTRVYRPAVHNLIFVRGTANQVQAFKNTYGLIQYLMRKVGKEGREKIIVPDRQMEQFIRICESNDDSLRYVELSEMNIRPGSLVRIIGGAFDGLEGYFMKIRGTRNRRLVVAIPDIAAASVEVSPDLVEVLGKA